MNEHWSEYPVVRGWETVSPFFEIIAGRGFIAGSYAAFMAYAGNDPVLPNDLDIFATNHRNATEIASDLMTYRDKMPHSQFEFSTPVVTIGKVNGIEIQIVDANPVWKTFPDDLMNDFDFDTCRACLIAPNTVIADVNVGSRYGKILRINNPLRSLKRVLKYHARGVDFSDHELLKLFQAWDQLSPDKREEMIAANQPSEDSDGSYPDFWNQDDWFEGE